jgi:hypothetical protein
MSNYQWTIINEQLSMDNYQFSRIDLLEYCSLGLIIDH